MKRTFTVIVERDPESGWLVSAVVELPGCHSEAPDLAALQDSMQEAIRGYLAVAELDEPAPDFVGPWRVEVSV